MESNQNQLRNKKWINLIASDWFSMFFEYLKLYDIAQTDSAFCNHKDRPVWLNLMRNARPIVVVNDLNSQGIIDWLELKDVHPSGIIIYGENDKITPNTLLRLSRISSKLRSLKCHSDNCISICSTLFQCLGDYNPLLEKLVLSFYCESESTTDVEQFKTALKHFLAGCPLLSSISLKLTDFQTQANDICIQICSTLFQCLGDYNPLLEEFDINSYSEYTALLFESDVELFNEPIKHFLVRCPRLSNLTIRLTELPSQCITTIANYALNLETFKIDGEMTFRGGLLGQRPIITKETNKLKKLAYLNLSNISRGITDESLINLVTGCNQLEIIDIDDCYALTDISLYSIAENCPKLKEISLPLGYSTKCGITAGLLELVNKCSKLTKINTLGEMPEVIIQKLKKRLTY